jgi:type II secretory pathway component GspD/PulD (secretin)
VADPATNSLLVKASPLDTLLIRQLLQEALDTPRDEAAVEVRTWIIGPLKNADVVAMAKVIREAFRGDADRPAASGFSVAADPASNSLVLRSSPILYQDILKLVEALDGKTPPKK